MSTIQSFFNFSWGGPFFKCQRHKTIFKFNLLSLVLFNYNSFYHVLKLFYSNKVRAIKAKK